MGQGVSGLIKRLFQLIAVDSRLCGDSLRHLIDFDDVVEAFQVEGNAAIDGHNPALRAGSAAIRNNWNAIDVGQFDDFRYFPNRSRPDHYIGKR